LSIRQEITAFCAAGPATGKFRDIRENIVSRAIEDDPFAVPLRVIDCRWSGNWRSESETKMASQEFRSDKFEEDVREHEACNPLK